MVSADLRIDGTERIRGNLRRLSRRLPGELTLPAQRRLAQWGQRYARANQGFRNRTWNANRSIEPQQQRNAPGTGRFESGWALTAGGRRAPYFRFLERGTRHISPRRTLQRAFNAMRRIARRLVVQDTRRRFPGTVRRIIR